MSERVQDLHELRIGKVVRAYERGMPLSEIAQRVGVSPPTISKWLTKEGYKHKNKGRIPLAMKARVRDLHVRGWSEDEISKLLRLNLDRVREFSDPKQNPILGLDKDDPLRVKGLKPKKKKRSKRGRPPKKKKKEEPGWPPPRHKCRKHWTTDEKAFVLQLIQKKIPPGVIYKRMRASRKRQIRIWRESGGTGTPPNFPPPKGPFIPPEGPPPPPTPEAIAASERASELQAAGEAELAALEAEAADRKARIAELEAQKKADAERLKELSREAQAQAELLESAEAAMEMRKKLPAPKPTRRRVEEGSYEAEVLGLPVDSLVEPKKPGRPRTRKPIPEYADNGRYFTVSKDWADLRDAKPDELALFARHLTSKRFPARVERSGDQPRAYFENTWPAKIEERWVKAVDSGLELLEKYREKKLSLKKNKGFSKRIAVYLVEVYDGYRNPRMNAAQKAEARERAADQWARLSKLERLVMIYDMKYADTDGKPTSLGVDRSQAAKILVEKAARRAKRKLQGRRTETKRRAIQEAAESADVGEILDQAKEKLEPATEPAPEPEPEPEDEVDEVAAMLAAAQKKFALPEGEED
jgi:transcriptional regulator with XRE-family HTH domain